MGLFNKAKSKDEKTVYKMIVDRGNGFYSWDGKLYRSDIVRACIKPRTKALGKCVAKHIRTTVTQNEEGQIEKKIETNPSVNIRFLLEEPNVYMSGQMLQEKVANQLSLNGNAFIFIMRDANGIPVGLYPIPAASVTAIYDEYGELWLKFYYESGKNDVLRYSDILHIREDFISNDLFGDQPQEALASIMDAVGMSDQGMKSAIKNSSVVRWLLKFTSAMRPEDIKENTKRFAEDYLSVESGGLGVAAVDAKADAIQVQPHDYVPNAAQTNSQVDRIYAYFGTNEKIVHSTYTEDEWISYYEQAVEPIAAQMSREYSRKLFSRLERSRGNQIVFESSALTFASMKSKLELVQFVDRGIMTPNEVRGYLNLVPIPGGDVALLRKDTGYMGDDRSEGGEEE